MYKIFSLLRTWLGEVFAAEAVDAPLARMCPRDLADLPVHHPRRDEAACSGPDARFSRRSAAGH